MDKLTESPGRYRPLSRKYDTIDRRYKFFKANSAACLQMHYPLLKDEMGRHICQVVSSFSEPYAGDFERQILKEREDDNRKKFGNKQEVLTTVNDLPDDILLIIFGYCHPIDLINCFSLVSRRWNNLANHSTLLSEVRVLVTYRTLAYKSVKRFFAKVDVI
ncbi:F-box domain-containing protein [Loa loa]|uniref:F-box domain-containing protein n=1 Tax=Loa loa TaxID=7209 RepID=A0A1S0U7R4_LOALO|nr:F-box domain-containing protein [Loa loa]EFO25707.1 F-box domain-containing protein [Loa loa]